MNLTPIADDMIKLAADLEAARLALKVSTERVDWWDLTPEQRTQVADAVAALDEDPIRPTPGTVITERVASYEQFVAKYLPRLHEERLARRRRSNWSTRPTQPTSGATP